MKLCPTCKNEYSDDANFCPRGECAGPGGPQRLVAAAPEPPARFVPISRLGGGASGEVWQASDSQSGGAVAYKIVAAESLPTVTAVERAQRELRQLQRANNPHIVKVVDFGKTTEGRLFVASELASGEPLDQVVERVGPMTLDRAKRIAAQIGEALLEAQKVGVVHRDLAAKNILVSADDEVRLINFAIPRPLFDNLFGVPQYMSPEQSEGKLIDQRSNTYSLGSLFYLMLTGHPPHTGETPRAVVAAIQKGELVPPSIKRGGGLTAEVDRIVLKALERNSSRRPLTMRQFLTDLSGLIVTDEQASATVAAPATGGGSGRDAAFARTMMFAGGATEVQKLVAQAVAARQVAGNGASEPLPAAAKIARSVTPPPLGEDRSLSVTPAAAPAAPVPVPSEAQSAATPSSAGRPAHGAAVAATMVAIPASTGPVPSPLPLEGGGVETSGQSLSPVKIPAATNSPPGGAGGTPIPEAGPNFRETLWFKKGDVDQMVADARAKMAAIADAKKASTEAEGPAEEAKPLEDRYVDDGTVTVEDREKFSLGSGGTSASMRARAASVPGERMSEDEILNEIGGGKRVVIIAIVGAVVVALIAVIAVSMKSGRKDKTLEGAATPPAATSAAPENPPTPPPAAAAPENAATLAAPAPADKAAPTPGAQSEPDDGGGAAAKPSPPKKRTTTKKKAPTAVKKRK